MNFFSENGALLQFPQRVNRSSLKKKDEEPSTGRFHPGGSGQRWFWDEGLGSSRHAHMLEPRQGDTALWAAPPPLSGLSEWKGEGRGKRGSRKLRGLGGRAAASG